MFMFIYEWYFLSTNGYITTINNLYTPLLERNFSTQEISYIAEQSSQIQVVFNENIPDISKKVFLPN